MLQALRRLQDQTFGYLLNSRPIKVKQNLNSN